MGFSDLNNAQVVGGATKVTISEPSTGFGELLVSQNTVQAQGDFVYNVLNNQVFEIHQSIPTVTELVHCTTSDLGPDSTVC